MPAKRKYYNLIKVIHEEWCADNGYPKHNKIPVSGTKERETAPSGIKTEDLIDYKKFHQMMVTQLKAPSVKHQAPGAKQQASSSSNPRPKRKVQAPSRKLQASLS